MKLLNIGTYNIVHIRHLVFFCPAKVAFAPSWGGLVWSVAGGWWIDSVGRAGCLLFSSGFIRGNGYRGGGITRSLENILAQIINTYSINYVQKFSYLRQAKQNQWTNCHRRSSAVYRYLISISSKFLKKLLTIQRYELRDRPFRRLRYVKALFKLCNNFNIWQTAGHCWNNNRTLI